MRGQVIVLLASLANASSPGFAAEAPSRIQPLQRTQPSAELIQEVQSAAESGGRRTILANSFGQTVYVFDPDQAAGRPTCNDQCAEAWPPLTISDEEVAALSNPELSVMQRDSGLNQLAYKGRPLYVFHFDRGRGDALGDGLGGVWHVVESDE